MIDRTYALDDVVEATRYVEAGEKTGNVVLRVTEASPVQQPEPAAKLEDEVPAKGTWPTNERHAPTTAGAALSEPARFGARCSSAQRLICSSAGSRARPASVSS